MYFNTLVNSPKQSLNCTISCRGGYVTAHPPALSSCDKHRADMKWDKQSHSHKNKQQLHWGGGGEGEGGGGGREQSGGSNKLIDVAWSPAWCDDVSSGVNSRKPRSAESTASQSVRVHQLADPTQKHQEPRADQENRLEFSACRFVKVQVSVWCQFSLINWGSMFKEPSGP